MGVGYGDLRSGVGDIGNVLRSSHLAIQAFRALGLGFRAIYDMVPALGIFLT